MPVRMVGPEPVLVSSTPSTAFAPTSTLLKFSEAGATASVDGLDTPTSEMNSSEVLALDEISTAPARVAEPDPDCAGLCGVKATVRVQLAPGTMVEQLLVTAKSGEDCRPKMLS